MLNLSFIPTSLDKCLYNALVNLGSWSNTITQPVVPQPSFEKKTMRSPIRLWFPQSAPCVQTWQTAPPSIKWHPTLVTPARLWSSSGTYYGMAWAGVAMVARGRPTFGKRLSSLGTSSKPSQSGLYPPLCTANGTSLIPFYGGGIVSPLWPVMCLSYPLLKTNSLNLPCRTYTRLTYIWTIRPPIWPFRAPCSCQAHLEASG